MASIAVEMVINKMATLLETEARLLGSVRQGVDELRDDLESMKAFLQDAEARSEKDQGVRTWVKQVRDAAYDAEDILEEFSVRLSPLQEAHGLGLFHFLRKGHHYIQNLRARHRLAIRIRNIKQKLKAISERKNAFSFQRSEENPITSSAALQLQQDPQLTSLFLDEADAVGIENPKNALISWLVGGEQDLTTITVLGMGGVGKTTLAKKAFDSFTVKNHFDTNAWITVSKSFTIVELLQAALKGLLEATKETIPDGIDTMSDLQLVTKLRNYLQQKRYVVVFDDIWSINAWQAVKFAFPDCSCGSRIVFTTRISEVAVSVETTSHVFHLQPLPEKEAWTLFCKKAFRGKYKGICPRELEEISQSILKKCDGLPLAIVLIGGLLSKRKKHVLEWKKVHDGLAAEIKSNLSLESLQRILLLSYKDLPYHLKCCYLYLSIFPEDYVMKRMKLVRLWVVERFVEEKAGLTMEEVAEDYLNELVSRSMIQVVEMDYFNRVRTCRLHDLMREIVQIKSRDESFVMVMNEKSLPLNEKVRRMAFHDSSVELSSNTRFPSLRSLFVFKARNSSMPFVKASSHSFRMLTVLELEGLPITKFPELLVGMIHLRYLSLRRTAIEQLPESIGKLRNLEILDLKYSLVSSLPDGILQLENLCQLRNYGYSFHFSEAFPTHHGMTVPTRIGKLKNLQKLGSIEVANDRDMLRDLGKLTQLRRLGILNLRQEQGMDLCYSIERMRQLTALYMASINPSEILELNSLRKPPQFLQRLYIKGNLPTLPNWIVSLQYVGKLVLQHTNLKDDLLMALQNLPNLVVLELREAYGGEELHCDARGYPRLKRLFLLQLQNLKSISVPEGAMPCLEELLIASCWNLERVPSGIEQLRNLRDLLLWDMPYNFLDRIEQAHGEDFWKVQHISNIKELSHLKRQAVRSFETTSSQGHLTICHYPLLQQ